MAVVQLASDIGRWDSDSEGLAISFRRWLEITRSLPFRVQPGFYRAMVKWPVHGIEHRHLVLGRHWYLPQVSTRNRSRNEHPTCGIGPVLHLSALASTIICPKLCSTVARPLLIRSVLVQCEVRNKRLAATPVHRGFPVERFGRSPALK